MGCAGGAVGVGVVYVNMPGLVSSCRSNWCVEGDWKWMDGKPGRNQTESKGVVSTATCTI